jgi:hypothetical protein
LDFAANCSRVRRRFHRAWAHRFAERQQRSARSGSSSSRSAKGGRSSTAPAIANTTLVKTGAPSWVANQPVDGQQYAAVPMQYAAVPADNSSSSSQARMLQCAAAGAACAHTTRQRQLNSQR